MPSFHWPSKGSGAGGDVVGPISATDNALVRFDGATGRLVQNSTVIADDLGNITGVAALTMSGNLGVGGTLSVTGATTLAASLSGVLKASAGVVSASAIVNADVNAAAAIAYSKLNLTGSIVNNDISAAAAIGLSKLAALTASRALVSGVSGVVSISTTTATQIGYLDTLTGNVQTALDSKTTGPASSTDSGFARFDGLSGKVLKDSPATIANADVSASAAIAYSKLNLSGSIVDTDISVSAAIAYSKLAALNSGNILVGSGLNVATGVAVTGDISISNTGVTAIATGAIVNADVADSAAIDFVKLANLTAGNILVGNGLHKVSSVTPSGAITIDTGGVTTYNGIVPKAKGGSGQDNSAITFPATGTLMTTEVLAPPTVQVITSVVPGTYTTPTGAKWLRVTMVGGGGGGGASGTASWGVASSGSNTTFGTTLLIAGNGQAGGQGYGPAGGTVTVNGPALDCGSQSGFYGGGASFNGTSNAQMSGGHGGGPGGGASAAGAAGLNADVNSGGGGGGGGMNGVVGSYAASGGSSGGRVCAIIPSPSASYSYQVGAGGTGGSAGTNGRAGGNGATGIIIVEAHYQ